MKYYVQIIREGQEKRTESLIFSFLSKEDAFKFYYASWNMDFLISAAIYNNAITFERLEGMFKPDKGASPGLAYP